MLLFVATLDGPALAQGSRSTQTSTGFDWPAEYGSTLGTRAAWLGPNKEPDNSPGGALPAPGGGGDAARELANRVNDPTEPLTQIQFRDIIAPHVPGTNGAGNELQVQPIIPILSSRFLPFDQLMKVTLPILVTTPSPESETGLGDLQVFDLVTINQSWGRWGFGPILVAPTASSTIPGQGKWQLGPSVALIYTGTKNLTVGAILQNPISFAGDSSRPAVNNLIVTPTLYYNLPNGWFAGFSDFNWNFNWKDGGGATIPVGLQAGKVFTIGEQAFSPSIEGGYTAARPHDSSTPTWLIGIEFTVILGEHTK